MVSSLEQTWIGSCIRYISIDLNRIYIIQWLLIAYTVAALYVTGAHKISSPLILVPAAILVLAASVGINATIRFFENGIMKLPEEGAIFLINRRQV